MKITVIGTGYVGLVTGACLAEMGNDVVCLDIDPRKIEILNTGGVPIHEPGLDKVVQRNAAAGRLRFTTEVAAAVAHGRLQFIAVGTPPDEDGSADLQYVLAAARNIGRLMTDYKLVIDKSTVPVGTADKVRQAISDELKARGAEIPFSVSSNPVFRARAGRTVVLALKNPGPVTTVFHLHGHHFRLLDKLDDGWKPYWLDTLAIEPEGH